MIFNDPRNVSSDKENAPPLESVTIQILNIMEEDFLDRTEKLLGKETKWEAHVAQQIPLPRSNSPYPNDRPGSLEQLEPEPDDDTDIRDYMERPANDRRPPKPNKRCGPSLIIQNNCPTPQTSPTYLAMTAASEHMKQPLKEIRMNPVYEKEDAMWMASMHEENTPKGGL